MPNTLAHLGVQTLLSKAIFPRADFKWIAVGCIIPDLPWILQRTVHLAAPATDPITLRIYVIIQASLFFCLIICGICSLLHEKRGFLFILLGFNCLLHLVLDSLQIKWANGVHLLAPFSWQLTDWGLFWPEHWTTTLLTILGFVAVSIALFRDRLRPVGLRLSTSTLGLSGVLLLGYLLLPLAFFNGPVAADNHYIRTLDNLGERPGKPIAVDRASYEAQEHILTLFTGERLTITGIDQPAADIISIKGYFTGNDTIAASVFHNHTIPRDFYTILGLVTALSSWLLAIFPKKSTMDRGNLTTTIQNGANR